MKFKELIFEWVLVENKEEIYKKYYSDIDRDTFIRIIKGDPKTVVTNNVIDFIGKHAKLLLNMYKTGALKIEDLPKANEYLTLVYHHSMPVDYKKIQTIPDLYNLVKDKIAKVNTSLSELIKLLSKEEYSVKHNGDSWFVIQPLSEKAAAYLGVNTEWCTTWGQYCLNPDYRDRTNHFRTYSPQGPLYIVVNKENESDKYQMHYASNQFKNPADVEISNRPKFFNERLELKKHFFPVIFEASPSIEEIKEQLPKVRKFLDTNDASNLMKIFMSYYGNENPLIKALSEEDDDLIDELVKDSNLNASFVFRSSHLLVELKELPRSVDGFESAVSGLRYQANEAYNSVGDSEYYYVRDSPKEALGGYLEAYYEAKKQDLIKSFGIICNEYDTFLNFAENAGIFDDETVKEKYVDEFVNGTGASAESAYNDEANRLEEFLIVDKGWTYKEFKMPIEKVVEYVSDKLIVSVDNLDTFMEGYLDFFDLPSEDYWEYPEYDYVTPTQDFMNDVFDNYFDTQHEDLLNNVDPECAENTRKFYDIYIKNFNNSDTFENEFVKITIKSPWFKSYSCEDGIALTYFNKKTNEKFDGHLSLENLINHMNIEPLFENLSFKNILREMKKGEN